MARILCVDDDTAALALRRGVLERAGHRVDVSGSARRSVEMLRSGNYDAIVTDWRLGADTARGLIQAARMVSAEMPVVVVSGFVAEAFQSGGPVADLYLDKPVDPAELLKIIDVLLATRRATENPIEETARQV